MDILTQSSKVIQADQQHLPEVFRMYTRCKESLLHQKIFQWDDDYPNEEYFHNAIIHKEMFLFYGNGQIAGSMVLNEWESEEWASIPWNYSKPLVLHSLFLEPTQQSKGAGAKMLIWAEDFARDRGYESIRLDAFSGNERSLKFYERKGYKRLGEVSFSSKPVGHTTYFCYEKKLC